MEDLFIKYIKYECSDEEMQQIVDYFKNSDDLSDVPTVDSVYDLLENYAKMDKDLAARIHDTILNVDKEERSKLRPVSNYWKYAAAASVAVLVTVGLWFLSNKDTSDSEFAEPTIVNNLIEAGTNKATLTLEDGTEVALTKGETYQINNATSNGGEIVYRAGERSNSKIAYNHLTIPRGGEFQLVLADGTKVWLNSESKLKYPTTFTSGQTRQVELVYGEAYFDVSPDTEHQGADFKVFHNQQEVQVLGTEFNIKAYKDETHIYTTLVEGKVSVTYKNGKQFLEPDQQSRLNTENNQVTVADVDVIGEISWINGEFRLQQKTLKEIMKVLSRWYDMDVEFANRNLEEVRFVGVLGKKQSIVDILNNLKNIGDINDYEIHNKTVTLK